MYPIADMHCDTLSCKIMASRGKLGFVSADGHINTEKLQRGGYMLQCFAAFIPTGKSVDNPDDLPAYEYFCAAAKAFERELEANPSLAPVLSMADVEKNQADGRISAMFTVEDGVPLEGRLERVDEMFDLGVRMICLTWNYENSLGYPNRYPDYADMQGLKPFGIEAVRRMNELGVIVDVSHLSDGGFWDVAKHSQKPFVASHSNARTLRSVVRNLTDDMLKALGDAGGMTGLNYCAAFLTPDEEHAMIADIVRHARHIADKAGVEALGLGSDLDGIDNTLEFGDASGMQQLMQGLEKEFTPREIELISHKNLLRVMSDNLS